MRSEHTATPSSTLLDHTTAHADAVAAVAHAGAEVSRLTTLLESTRAGVAAAEARAADAAGAADFDPQSDGDTGVMAAVATARARHDAVSTALVKAEAAEADAVAALQPLERRMRRQTVESTYLAPMGPALDQLDDAVAQLADAWQIVEDLYHSGTRGLIDSVEWPSHNGFVTRQEPQRLVMASRIRAMLFKRVGRDVLGDISGGVNTEIIRAGTLREQVEQMADHVRQAVQRAAVAAE